jgi:hypothetical protein
MDQGKPKPDDNLDVYARASWAVTPTEGVYELSLGDALGFDFTIYASIVLTDADCPVGKSGLVSIVSMGVLQVLTSMGAY